MPNNISTIETFLKKTKYRFTVKDHDKIVLCSAKLTLKSSCTMRFICLINIHAGACLFCLLCQCYTIFTKYQSIFLKVKEIFDVIVNRHIYICYFQKNIEKTSVFKLALGQFGQVVECSFTK